MRQQPPLHRIVLRADQVLHVGTGRGSGKNVDGENAQTAYSKTTLTHLPGSTVRGALCAAWWRENPNGDQQRFDADIAGLAFSDVVPTRPGTDGPAYGVALDRLVCKYPEELCPDKGYAFADLVPAEVCPVCHRAPEPSKGARDIRGAARVLRNTRVALSDQEQAEDTKLYERQALHVDAEARLTGWVAGNIDWLVKPETVLRVGAARTVAGRVVVEKVEEYSPDVITVEAGVPTPLRVELLTPGVFVDEFGFASDRPSAQDWQVAFGLPEGTTVNVEAAFTRWTTASGWHTKANRPKPEDAAVVAHSVFHLQVTCPEQVQVPEVVCDLGVRTSEGYGWARGERVDA